MKLDHLFHLQEHENLGDIEIITGWDDLRWYSLEKASINIDRIVLMNVALGRDERFQNIEDLARYIENHLRDDNRVIISRLYELDSTPRPWDQLSKLGWSREKLQQNFSKFDSDVIGQVDDVVFREFSLTQKQ